MIAPGFLYALFAIPLAAPAQSALPAVPPPSNSVQLNVVVDAKSGQPVTNLRQQDFTVLDNKSPRPITSFHFVSGAQEPLEVIFVIDAVNTPFDLVAFMRLSIDKFLKARPALVHPTTIAILTDRGIQIDNNFSSNGIGLAEDLEHRPIALREITVSSQWSDIDRLSLCVKALHQLVDFASGLPGRKMLLFVSPGWPLLSGPGYVLNPKEEKQVFGDIVYFSTQLRRADITLYDVNPIGVDQPIFDANYYENFLKGISKVDDAQLAGVGLQVLSVQTGGLTLVTDSDVPGLIEKCLLDAESWYEIRFDPPPVDKPNLYHRIEVRIDQPGLTVRTRDGYYSNPVLIPSR